MEKIVALCKGRGFIFAGSEIYGGLANTWDYGPLGAELKNNIKRAWWKKFVQENPYNVGLDSAILMNPQVWVASGHVSTFNDPLIDCKACKMRHRADKLVESYVQEHGMDVNVEAMTQEELVAFIRDNQVSCPGCGISTVCCVDIREVTGQVSELPSQEGITGKPAPRRAISQVASNRHVFPFNSKVTVS